MREWFGKEQVSKFPVELVVLVVRDLQQAVFHAEGVPEVVPQFVTGHFNFPTCQVLAVEKLLPLTFRGFVLCALRGAILRKRRQTHENDQEKRRER